MRADAALLCAMLAVGCSKSQPAPTSTESGDAPLAAPSATPAPSVSTAASGGSPGTDAAALPMATVNLLDAGRPPMRKLRYAWNARRNEQLSMELRTAAATEIGGTKQPEVTLPPVHITIAIEPQAVSPDGDLTYAWHVTSATVTNEPGAASQLVDGMRAEVDAVAHLAGTAAVTARGLTRYVVIDATSIVDAGATGQMVEQVRQTLRDVAAPLPEEEVGRGARWQKLSQLEAKDTRITQTETFTLTDVAGDQGTLDDVLAQTAPPQPLVAPGAQRGAQARMESMLASGDAKTRFDLTRLVPHTKFDGTTTMVVSGQSGEGARRMSMVMRVGMVIQGTGR